VKNTAPTIFAGTFPASQQPPGMSPSRPPVAHSLFAVVLSLACSSAPSAEPADVPAAADAPADAPVAADRAAPDAGPTEFSAPSCGGGPATDWDSDGVPNEVELSERGTDPCDADSDGDGIGDGVDPDNDSVVDMGGSCRTAFTAPTVNLQPGQGFLRFPLRVPALVGNGWEYSQGGPSPFGNRGATSLQHSAIDYLVGPGTPAYAACDGYALADSQNPTSAQAYGNMVLVRCNQRVRDAAGAEHAVYVLYGHLSRTVPPVMPDIRHHLGDHPATFGLPVTTDDVVGYSGKTGASWPHLHIQVFLDGYAHYYDRAIDPYDIRARTSAAGCHSARSYPGNAFACDFSRCGPAALWATCPPSAECPPAAGCDGSTTVAGAYVPTSFGDAAARAALCRSECPTGVTRCGGTTPTPACSDECAVAGQSRCRADGRTRELCGQHDADTCLEWGAAMTCATTCSAGACVVCAPRDCTAQGLQCGSADDGCGHPLSCGVCAGGDCVSGRCVQRCGNGTCDAGESCGNCAADCRTAERPDYADNDCDGVIDNGVRQRFLRLYFSQGGGCSTAGANWDHCLSSDGVRCDGSGQTGYGPDGNDLYLYPLSLGGGARTASAGPHLLSRFDACYQSSTRTHRYVTVDFPGYPGAGWSCAPIAYVRTGARIDSGANELFYEHTLGAVTDYFYSVNATDGSGSLPCAVAHGPAWFAWTR
jgi:hypothetical protein